MGIQLLNIKNWNDGRILAKNGIQPTIEISFV
jgi:hypothetical protein